MTGFITTISSPQPQAVPTTDPALNTNTLLLTGDFPVGALAFNTDASTTAAYITPQSTVRPDPFSPFQTGYFASQFNGSTRYYGPASSGSIVDSYGASGSFTIECWVNSPSYAGGQQGLISTIVPAAAGYWRAWGISNNATEVFYGRKDSSVITYVSLSQTMPTNEWFHFALVGTNGGTNLTWYINGVQAATTTDNTTFAAGGSQYQLCIGAASGTGVFPLRSKISNLRFVSATDGSAAVYTSAFTPSTSPLTGIKGTQVLAAQCNTFIDTSPLGTPLSLAPGGTAPIASLAPLFTLPVTTGSGYFNGTSDYLSFPSSTPVVFGSGDFTIEFWIYRDGTGGGDFTVISNMVASNSNAWSVFISGASNTLKFQDWASGYLTASTTVIAQNTWYHVAITRQGTALKMFVNGTLSDSATNSTNLSATNAFQIGRYVAAGTFWKGYISNLRLVKGTAEYTADFTPSTAPLLATANTTLLTLQSGVGQSNSTFVDSGPLNSAMTVAGTPYQGTLSPYAPAWSTSFNGSSDALVAPAGAQFNFTGDFTIECWFYARVTTGSTGLISNNVNNGAQDWCIIMNSSLTFYPSGVTGVSSAAFAANTWHHMAAVRSGTTCRLYLNGISQGTPLTVSGTIGDGTRVVNIGKHVANFFNGLISNLRVVNGTALYTSNFVPPAAPLTATSTTTLLTLQDGRFKDNSTNNLTLTISGAPKIQPVAPVPKSSVFFDGSTYLTMPAGSAAAVDSYGTSGAYTLEGWYYLTAPSNQPIMTTSSSLASAGNWRYWGFDTTSSVMIGGRSSAAYVYVTIPPVPQNQWFHMAIVTSNGGSNISVYVNGSLAGTATDASAYTAQTSYHALIGVGRGDGIGNKFNGYMSNLRFTNAAVYTTNFSVSPVPLYNINSTTLLALPGPISDIGPTKYAISTVGTGTSSISGPFGSSIAGSTYFSGSPDRIEFPSSANYALPADFTIEGWFYKVDSWNTGASSNALVAGDAGGGCVVYINAGNLRIAPQGSSSVSLGSIALLSTNTWHHIVITRKSSSIRAYVDGVALQAAQANSTSFSQSTMRVAGGADGFFNGYVSNVRIVKGSSVYDPALSTITVPTKQLTAIPNTVLLTLQNGTITDNSIYTAVPTINSGAILDPSAKAPFSILPYSTSLISGSTYFNGSSSLTAGPGTLGAGDFTVEYWVNLDSLGAIQAPLNNTFSVTDGNAQWTLEILAAGTIRFSGWSVDFLTSSASLTAKTWNHVAAVRNGGTLVLYLNGVSVGSVANSTSFSSTKAISIGQAAGGGRAVTGYIANARIVVGTAVYTAAFTPPTSPVTVTPSTATGGVATNKTTFLFNSTNIGVYDSSMAVDVQTFGTAGSSASTRKFGTSSLRPDDAVDGSYLRFLTTPQMAFGSGDFTIEFWMNYTTLGYIIDFSLDSTTGSAPQLYSNSANTLQWWANGGGRITSGAITSGVWNHIAICRSGTSTKMFLNGTQTGSTYSDTIVYTVNTFAYIGGAAVTPTSGNPGAYFEDFRISVGIARYTSNFTVPAIPAAQQ